MAVVGYGLLLVIQNVFKCQKIFRSFSASYSGEINEKKA